MQALQQQELEDVRQKQKGHLVDREKWQAALTCRLLIWITSQRPPHDLAAGGRTSTNRRASMRGLNSYAMSHQCFWLRRARSALRRRPAGRDVAARSLAQWPAKGAAPEAARAVRQGLVGRAGRQRRPGAAAAPSEAERSRSAMALPLLKRGPNRYRYKIQEFQVFHDCGIPFPQRWPEF